MGKIPSQSVEIANRHSVYLERLKTGHAQEFRKFLKIMQGDILDQIHTIDSPADISARRLQEILNAVNAALDTATADYAAVWRAQVDELGAYSAEFEQKTLGKIAKYDWTLPAPGQISAAVFAKPLSVEGVYGGMLLDDFFADMMGKTKTRVAGVIRLAAAQGMTTQDLASRIRGTEAAKFRDGLMAISERDAETLARTSLHHVAQVAREETWKANSGAIERVEFLAVLDGRTSTVCRGLSGQRFDIDKGPVPPLHLNCRSNRIPVFNDGLDFLDGAGHQFTRGPDGPKWVASNQTYYGWLKTQSAEFQDSVIGPVRGKLLRNGGISADRFAELQLDKTFHPLTLAEMRKLEPLAFENAGI